MSTTSLAWGILSTGAIARKFARGLARSRTGRLVAVASRSLPKAQAFVAEHAGEGVTAHGSYDELLADPAVEAVYIATPHPMHAYWTIRAAEAGKHILCEKPLGLNAAEAMAMIEAARAHDVFLMEAFMYRCHPQTLRLANLVRAGAIGRLQLIDAPMCFRAPDDPQGRLLNPELGGGGILDVGCYPASLARLLAGAQLGLDFAEPVEVQGTGVRENGIDAWATASLRFEGDTLATLTCGVRLTHPSVVRLYGETGRITVPQPWFGSEGGRILIERDSGESETMTTTEGEGPDLYALEADEVAAHIADRQSPAMAWDDTLGNLRLLDKWRADVGVTYPAEAPDRFTTPLHGRPLRRAEPTAMPYDVLPGLDKPVSRLVMGCDNQRSFPHGAVMWDDFFERGGNTFDTAWLYGGGEPERILGQWIRSRGVRDKVVVIAKGAHTPACYPAEIERQLLMSLERLGTDHADVYFMHRDNPEVPVGEFVDALNRQRDAGRMRVFGGSNWSIERLREANRYAKRKGLEPLRVVSNNFSLARLVEPVWPGCLAASDLDFRAFLAESGLALMAWSSQARGFFAGRAHPDDLRDAELVRCWYSDQNFQRLDRARELAREKGVSPINIALAYVLAQPFKTYCLVGPRTREETRTTWDGLRVELTPGEVDWLDLARNTR